MEVCLIVLSRLSAANSHDRLIEELYNRGPDKRGCTVLHVIETTCIANSPSVKDLGVLISCDLKWCSHILRVISIA